MDTVLYYLGYFQAGNCQSLSLRRKGSSTQVSQEPLDYQMEPNKVLHCSSRSIE
uniref:Uncharacterized protein n=1 Tax=Tetranychus urticae TaxID=32264 RepID=T1KD23_TETUR